MGRNSTNETHGKRLRFILLLWCIFLLYVVVAVSFCFLFCSVATVILMLLILFFLVFCTFFRAFFCRCSHSLRRHLPMFIFFIFRCCSSSPLFHLAFILYLSRVFLSLSLHFYLLFCAKTENLYLYACRFL